MDVEALLVQPVWSDGRSGRTRNAAVSRSVNVKARTSIRVSVIFMPKVTTPGAAGLIEATSNIRVPVCAVGSTAMRLTTHTVNHIPTSGVTSCSDRFFVAFRFITFRAFGFAGSATRRAMLSGKYA